jgi:hypothetical protein
MAEDKRIRVSADASPLQELRQNAQALWNDFNKMESEFKNIAEQTVGVIQKQIDLLKERNALAGGMQGGLPNDTPTERRPTLIDPYTGRPLSGGGGAVAPGTSGRALNTQLTERQQTTLDKILSEVVRIADLMEKTQRDDTNGVLPTGSGGEPPQPPAPETPDLPTPGQGGGAGLFGKGFKMPTSMSGLMGMLPFGALIMGIGTILGQQAKYESAQYGAENEFQRRNNRGNHWLLNMLTFGISGAEAEKKEVGRNAATQNDRALGDYSALHRMSYRQALGSQFVDSFGDNVDYVTGGNTTYHDYKMATDWSYRQKQSEPKDPTKLDLSGLAFPKTQQDAEAWKDWEYGQKRQQLYKADKAGLVTDRDELPTWASRTLGLNMTDYLPQVTTLQKAGVYERNTSLHDVNQLLMAGKIRGLSEDDAASVLATTRFDRSGRTGANVVQAFDTNLQGLGKSDQYIASTLGEYLQSFNRMAENVLNRTGGINTAGIVRSMTSIQNATGMEGRQLERVQNSLMGNNISQDDVSQALLLRTAREVAGPDAQLSDLQAMIEQMPEKPELQQQFFERIQKMTGGGEMGRQVMKSIFPNLSMTDIIDLEKATGNDAQKIFRRGRSTGAEYSEAEARSMVGDIAASTAATQNRKIKDGYEEILGGKGSIASVVKALKEEGPIPVTIVAPAPGSAGPIPVTIVAPAPGSAGSGSGQQGGFPALQLTDEQLQKLRESVAAGTKDGASRALNNLTITQE